MEQPEAVLDIETIAFFVTVLGGSDGRARFHLLVPAKFEAITPAPARHKILQHLGDRLPKRTFSDDRDLFALRRALAPEYGPRYDYYSPPVAALWQQA